MTVPTPGPPISRPQMCSATRFEHPESGGGLPGRLGPCEKPYGHTGPHLAQGVGWFDRGVSPNFGPALSRCHDGLCDLAENHAGAHHRPSLQSRQVTVDDLLNDPARLHRRVAEYAEARNIFQAFGFDPAIPDPSRREKLRRAVDDRLSNARTWLALRIAPWLNTDQDW